MFTEEQWKNIKLKQKELDEIIYKNHYVPSLDMKQIALLVEIGEFANEVKSFKYWSQNKQIDRNKILGELADILHFITSFVLESEYYLLGINEEEEKIIIDKNINYSKLVKKLNENLNDFILSLYLNTIYYNKINSKVILDSMLHAYFKIAAKLNITGDMLYAAYMEKNRINLERQIIGY